MSGTRRAARHPEESHLPPPDDYVETEADLSTDEHIPVENNKLDKPMEEEDGKRKAEFKGPNFESWTQEQMREYLRRHHIKGTWASHLVSKCRETWDTHHASDTNGNFLPDEPGTEGDSAPDFASWDLDRKRGYLKKRDVKGIWAKNLDAKCSDVWKAEKNGDKYIHTPPSLSKTIRSVYPSNNIMSNTLSPESAPLSMETDDFMALYQHASREDLKSVTQFLNAWSSKHISHEEHSSIETHMIDETINRPRSIRSSAPTTEVVSTQTSSEIQWINTEVVEGALRTTKSKRPASMNGAPNPKRPKTSETESNSSLANNNVTSPDNDMMTIDQQLQIMQDRINLLEQQNRELLSENKSLKDKAIHLNR